MTIDTETGKRYRAAVRATGYEDPDSPLRGHPVVGSSLDEPTPETVLLVIRTVESALSFNLMNLLEHVRPESDEQINARERVLEAGPGEGMSAFLDALIYEGASDPVWCSAYEIADEVTYGMRSAESAYDFVHTIAAATLTHRLNSI
jgi:hypothetical protein